MGKTVKDIYAIEEISDIVDKDGMPIIDLGAGAHQSPAAYLRVKGHDKEGNKLPVDLRIEDGFFSWSTDSAPTLRNISVTVKEGSFVGIVGSTGQGKSSLMNAMLGEMHMTHGRAKVQGAVAYAPQQAWIYNATVKENILFGNDFDPGLYDRAIEISQLKVCTCLPSLLTLSTLHSLWTIYRHILTTITTTITATITIITLD